MKLLRVILITIALLLFAIFAAYHLHSTVPKGAKVLIELDKDHYFFGELVLLKFCLENNGEKPFSFQYGGDYRGGTRSARFRVRVKDENGNVMPDPNIFQAVAGGMLGGHELKPSEYWCHWLPLSRYAYLEKPGMYSIEAYHDLGWKGSYLNPLPKGKTTIMMQRPDESQMKQYLEVMYTLPDHYNSSCGKREEKAPASGDFTALAHPIYIPLLLEKAQQNDTKAFDAIRSIPKAVATKALIGLLDVDNPEFVIKVFEFGLKRRIPDPDPQEFFQAYQLSKAYQSAFRNWIEEVWRDEFVDDLLTFGRKFLTSESVTLQSHGADIIRRLGKADDMSSVISSLTTIIEKTKHESLGVPYRDNSPFPIFGVVKKMVKKYGFQLSHVPQTSGEIAVYLNELTIDKTFRPEGWKSNVKKWLKHETEFIRALALDSLNNEVIDEVKESVLASLSNHELRVRMAACRAVRRHDIDAKDEIIESFVDIDNDWALGCWVGVAKKQGMRFEILNVLVDGLKEGNSYCHMISSIADLLVDEETGGSSCDGYLKHEQLVNIKNRLKDFLIQHKERLKADKGFRFADKEITSDLLFHFSYLLSNRERWPSQRPEVNHTTVNEFPINSSKN